MPDRNNDELFDRYRELCKAHEELYREFCNDLRPNWQIYLGKISIPVQLNSTGFSWLYAGSDITVFAFGIICIFFRGSWKELGIALIVGAMFGMSTFVGRLLSVQLTNEQHQNDLLWRDALTLKYAPRFAEINEQIKLVLDRRQEQLNQHLAAGDGDEKLAREILDA